MASSYALPSSHQTESPVDYTSTSPSKQSRAPYTAHSHHESHGTGYHTARNSITSSDRKEVLHGTGVAIQHAVQTQWKDSGATSSSASTMQEVVAGALLVLPLLLASQLHPDGVWVGKIENPSKAQELAQLKDEVLSGNQGSAFLAASHLVEAMILASAVLLLLGIVERLAPNLHFQTRFPSDATDRAWNEKPKPASDHWRSIEQLRALAVLTASTLLPFYIAIQLGGWRIALVALISNTTTISFNWPVQKVELRAILMEQSVVALLCFVACLDFIIHANSIGLGSSVAGYSATAAWLALRGTLVSQTHKTEGQAPLSSPTKQAAKATPADTSLIGNGFMLVMQDNHFTVLLAGAVLSITTILLAVVSGASPSVSLGAMITRTLSISLTVLGVYIARPDSLRSPHRVGFYSGAALCIAGLLLTHTSWLSQLLNLSTAALAIGTVLFEGTLTSRPQEAAASRFSPFTQFLIERCEPDSLYYNILIEKDSRRIAYFTCLNFAFMLVQGLYGYLSGSLGLLSDTVHMFFDCLGLIVGLGAAVASKWPPSAERPFGWGQLNILAGFGNGIFLMLVSVEFAWEAIEGILDGHELRRVKELLVVSTLGLVINMVGLFAFGHAHAGHDHSHGHSHGHSHTGHDHSHGHSHGHSHAGHDHSHGHGHGHPHADPHAHHHDHDHSHAHEHHNHSHHGKEDSHSHSHSHNENMHGIFLHVAADAGGSLAVIISTALTLMKPWYLWDPLATIIIAILIFAAAVPLVQSSGRKLLLIIPDETEHGVKGFLQEVTEVRGTLGYAAPRFWLSEQPAPEEHDHDHNHCEHDHTHTSEPRATMVGSVHIIAAPFADLEDVRERVQDLAVSKGIRATIQVEYETDSHCWCGGSQRL